VSDLFVALRGCLVAVARRSSGRRGCSTQRARISCAKRLAACIRQRSHSPRSDKGARRSRTAVALSAGDTNRARCAVDSGLFPALLQYRPHSAEDMVKHRDCIDAIVRGVDAAVDTVDEATWASFLAYIAGSEGEVVLRAKLAMSSSSTSRTGLGSGTSSSRCIRPLRLMKTTDYLRCPSNRLDVCCSSSRSTTLRRRMSS
jgi:hypothetical protein